MCSKSATSSRCPPSSLKPLTFLLKPKRAHGTGHSHAGERCCLIPKADDASRCGAQKGNEELVQLCCPCKPQLWRLKPTREVYPGREGRSNMRSLRSCRASLKSRALIRSSELQAIYLKLTSLH